MIRTKEILPGVTLRYYRDTRFKQGSLSFQLLREMKKEEAAMNAMIPAVLLRGTRRCPDLRAIIHQLDELYGATVSSSVRRVGDYQTLGLYCAFMDDRFALEGDRVLEPMVDFLRELLLEYPVTDGGFDPDFVQSEKRNLIATIEAQLNDKRAYAMSEMLRRMCGEDTFGLPRLGMVEDVRAVEPVGLLRHYRQALKESPIHIFYVGSGEFEAVEALLKPWLAKLERTPGTLPPQTSARINMENASDTREIMDVVQGKLCMGFVTDVTNRDPDFLAMQMLNAIFGGGMTSKLFVNVREKLSLCYSISSGYYGSKGILAVSAGIDPEREQQVRAEILAQLEACRAGEITRLEMEAAREFILSSLRSTYDSPGSIESYYATAALSGLDMTPAQYMEQLGQVSVADVAAAAEKVRLHTVYFLKGGESHA